MPLHHAIKSFRKLGAGAYITPWRDHARAQIMMIGGIGNFGLGAMSFALNYSIAAEGLTQTLLFQIPRLVFMGFIAVPFVFWFISRYQSRWLLAFLQLFGLSLFTHGFSCGALSAIAMTFSYAPFLALHSYRFAKTQSRDNRGNEVALNSTLIIIAYSSGIFFSGLAMHYGHTWIPVFFGSLCCIVCAFFLFSPIKGRNNVKKVRGLVGLRKPSSRITFFNGLFSVMVEGCMPIWMQTMGISALGAGANMSLRPMIGMLLTPAVGWFVQKGGLKAAQVGGGAMNFAWLFVGASIEWPWILPFGMAVLTSGSNLVSPMEVGRWFKRRSSAGVIAREMVVASGRIPAFGAGIAVSFLCPALYPALGLVFSGLFIWAMRPRRRGLSQRIKEAVGLE